MGKDKQTSQLERAAQAATGAESLLLGLKAHGVDYLFANAGTDFPPVIEALASLPADSMPQPVTVPHETASVAMAHGYYLATGRAQALMVHVNVGLANAVMGVINAASDNIPIVVMSGRTPITESGRPGSRMTPVQVGQEMFNQSSLVSDVVKFHYEMRYPEQGEPLVARATALANSEPKGPVYLSLPREPLTAKIEPEQRQPASLRPAASKAHPDPDAIFEAAKAIAHAKAPLILVQRGDWEGHLSASLQNMAQSHGIAVCEPFSVRNVMPTDHPMLIGYNAKSCLENADVVVVLDCSIPWIEALSRPSPDVKIIHIGSDPHFARMPIRGYRTDLAIHSDPATAVDELNSALNSLGADAGDRRAMAEKRHDAFIQSRDKQVQAACATPMGVEWMSHCIGEAMNGEDAAIFTELGVIPNFMTVDGPNRIFSHAHSGGLGWALPAALGGQLADREKLTIACMGDGSYVFANPVACHQIAEALELPVLTIIKNNGLWNAVRRSVLDGYPDGEAAKANAMPLTSLEPAPDYLKVAGASRAFTRRVENGSDLPDVLNEAISVIRKERRQVVLDVRIAVSDTM